MTPGQYPQRGQARPRSATPAERSAEFAAHQDKLKKEAAERRLQAGDAPRTPRTRTGEKTRRRG
jgi:hypothetical protein